MITLLPAHAYRAVPWKNGQGITHDIAAEKEQEPDWRLSIATIDRDGPFSDFSGYDRTIMRLDGDDIELHFHDDGSIVTLEQDHPFRFAGERQVSAHLSNAPARDFNVITRRAEYKHEVNVRSKESILTIDGSELCFVLVLKGAISQPIVAREGDTLQIVGPRPVRLVFADNATMYAVVRIRPS